MTKFAVIKFSANWCAPCRACAPHFHQLKKDFPSVDFHEADIEKNHDVADAYRVTTLPTFVLLKDGVEVNRMVGSQMLDLVRKELVKMIEVDGESATKNDKQSESTSLIKDDATER